MAPQGDGISNNEDSGLLVQIATYNTNLQGVLGLPQDLVDWLAPTLQVSKFLSGGARAPDIVAVGFQELLPLHLGRALHRYRCLGQVLTRTLCYGSYWQFLAGPRLF